MGYLPDATIAALSGTYNLGLFFRLGTTPPITLWWGVSDIPAVIADLDADGTIYQGAGMLTDMPDSVEMLINGIAERVDWMIDGVNPELTANIAPDAASVVGLRATFGIAPLDSRWQMMSDIIVIWEGTADFWSEDQPPQPDLTKPKTRRLTLATMTGDSSRSLPYFATWTNAIQHLIAPDDTFCSRVPRYYVGQIVRWPAF